LKAGYNYGETLEIIKTSFVVPRAKFEKGVYRNIMGNEAVAYGLLAAAQKSGLDYFTGAILSHRPVIFCIICQPTNNLG
jgi:2-oxoglutarate ferredoxin oxidoreductase subunit alpha